MKQLQLFSLLTAGSLFLGACSVSDDIFTGIEEPDGLPENAIRFDTYMGGNVTRSGYHGTMNTDVLKNNGQGNGFGVFAYYTGTKTYNAKGLNGTGTDALGPNFMYNEKIKWQQATSEYIDPETHKTIPGKPEMWTYSSDASIKYWPNEVQEGAVDDQDPAATTNHDNGGKLTFFAYAPFTGTSDQANGTPSHDNTRGIAKFTGNGYKGDPIVDYILASDSYGKVVDLLWGTYGQTSSNVLGLGNAGVESSDLTAGRGILYPIADRSDYSKDILKGYKTNADLTKQKTNGRVGFNFKHALAKVGGESTSTSPSTTNGMMIILDIDKDGALKGSWNHPLQTLVTVESIKIKANKVKYDSNNDGTLDAEGYVKGGRFNLATGKWFGFTTGDSGDALQYEITPKAVKDVHDIVQSNVMNPAIAEPDAGTLVWDQTSSTLKVSVDGSPYQFPASYNGVLAQAAQNVFATESSPFVFFPGTIPSFNITITYYVRVYDRFLDKDVASGGEGTWTKVKQTISKDVTFSDIVELNKQYNILIHLGLTSVKFTATVSDWDVDWNDENSDGVVQQAELIVKDVDLPINVAEATAEVAYASGTKALPDVAAGTMQVTLTVTGLSDDTYAAASDAGNPAGDAISPASTELSGGTADQKATLTLTLAPNTGTSEVTHTFTFGSATYTVKQKTGPLSVKVTTSSYSYEEQATAVDPGFTVKDYGGTAVSGATFSTTDTWLTITESSTGKLTLKKNESTHDRQATITAKKDDATGTVTISQEHASISVAAAVGAKETPDSPAVPYVPVTLTATNAATGTAIDLSEGHYTLSVSGGTNYTDNSKGTINFTANGTYTVTQTIDDAGATASFNITGL